MRRQTLAWPSSALLLLTLYAAARTQEPWDAAVICHGSETDGSLAFPDICRLKSGELLCVFYSGTGHVTTPSDKWPQCGRIMSIRSNDEGKTWSKPKVVMDTPDDDRDASLVCLKDGTLLMNWFTLVLSKPFQADKPWSGVRLLLARSTDSGRTWSEAQPIEIKAKQQFACSSPIRRLSDGSLLLPLYCEGENGTFGATIKSHDGGKTWEDLASIGEKSGLYLDAETDVVELRDGRLLAALRSSYKKGLYQSESSDKGKTWTPVTPFGFSAHCPYFLRHSSGVILLGCRLTKPTSKIGDQTALYWSEDEGKTWQGPVTIDTHGGAYPSMVELSDHEVYCVTYDGGDEKAQGSSIWGKRLRVTPKGVEVVPNRKQTE